MTDEPLSNSNAHSYRIVTISLMRAAVPVRADRDDYSWDAADGWVEWKWTDARQ